MPLRSLFLMGNFFVNEQVDPSSFADPNQNLRKQSLAKL